MKVGLPLHGIDEYQEYNIGDYVVLYGQDNLREVLKINFAGQRTVQQVLVSLSMSDTWIRVDNVKGVYTPEEYPEYFL